MSQGSLFDASVYTLKAYDQLVLAYDQSELEQLRSLKSQVIRTYVVLQEMRSAEPILPEPLLSVDDFSPAD